MALDLGSKTIGLAGGDLASRVASPWEVLARKGNRHDVQRIGERAQEEKVGLVVVGLPLELDGKEGHRARLVLSFVKTLRAQLEAMGLKIEVQTWDERFSTQAAQRSMLQGDLSRERRKSRVDAVAAQMILSSWMDARALDYLAAQSGSFQGGPDGSV